MNAQLAAFERVDPYTIRPGLGHLRHVVGITTYGVARLVAGRRAAGADPALHAPAD
jgi:hypothetical protein